MSEIERITITVTAKMAQTLRGAVQAGEYASSSEIIREALRDWRFKRQLQQQQLEGLRTHIQAGLDDIETGRVEAFNSERIVKKGRKRLAKRAPSK